MPSQEETQNQLDLLMTYRRTLAVYLKQLANLGGQNAPPGIINGIREARENIHRIKRILQEWTVPVEPYPDDEDDHNQSLPALDRLIASQTVGRLIVEILDGPATAADTKQLRHNLPERGDAFIGRTREIREVKRQLAATHLLTLVGFGGIGKTRLALQVAHDLLPEYSNGVWLIELASVNKPMPPPQEIAASLGRREELESALMGRLVHRLRDKRMLLLLDNCEQQIEACARLTVALLQTCPQLRIVATSRERLGVSGEIVFQVPTLPIPHYDDSEPPALLIRNEAIHLFVERAKAAAPAFRLTETNTKPIVKICQRLEGIPLALELAAAWIRWLSIVQVEERLRRDGRFRLLGRGDRAAPSRHQALRNAIDWSYTLLSEQEQQLLRRLAVFSGGWTLEAVEAICAGEDMDPTNVLSILTSLVDKSLVVCESKRDEMRYRLLDTMREYALERLEQSGELVAVQMRHRDYYLQLAEQAAAHINDAQQPEALQILDAEHDNFTAALAYCKSHDVNGEIGLRLASALGRFWDIQGYLTEGFEQLRNVLASEGTPEQNPIRADSLYEAGVLAARQRRYADAEPLLIQAEALYIQIGNRRGAARARTRLATVRKDQFEYQDNPEAVRAFYNDVHPYYLESLALVRPPKDDEDERVAAFILNHLGNLEKDLGNFEAAESHYSESLDIRMRVGSIRDKGDSTKNLADVAYQQGDLSTALQRYYQALQLFRQVSATGDKQQIAYAVEGIAGVAMKQEQTRIAALLFGAADSIRHEIGSPLTPSDRRTYYDQAITDVVAALGQETFQSAWAEGQRFTIDKLIDEVSRYIAYTAHST